MKWIAAAVALILLYGLPFHRYDTAKLLPIRCVQAQREGGRIHILSEAGEGYGATWQEAVEDLRRNAPGEVFFDTAEQGVFSDEALARQAAESGDLRPGAEVFFRGALEDPGELYAYLSQHGSNKKIRDYGKVGKGDGREY
ncbi:MAG: hypothetical protein IKM59_01695 [Oscillospiraceae bacterium]|nr:hypothetical protein [Oscillospiraceae bacterium]